MKLCSRAEVLQWSGKVSPPRDARGTIRARASALLMIVGHSGHGVGRGLAPQHGHGCVICRDEIANDNAHGAVTQESSRRIVVGRSDFENVACGKLVAALVEKQDRGHAEKFAVVVYFG